MRSTTFLRLVVSLAIALACASGALAASYRGENHFIRGFHAETVGRLQDAETIYLEVIARKYSEQATRKAMRRLLDLARRRGDAAAELRYLQTDFQAGNLDAARRIASIQVKARVLPTIVKDLAPAYETHARAGHASSALALAELADLGRLGDTRVSEKDAIAWYRLAAQNGSSGAVVTVFERELARGRHTEAARLLAALPAAQRQSLALKAAKTLAFGKRPAPAKVILSWTARLSPVEADRIHARLAKQSADRGDIAAYTLWIGKTRNVAAVDSVGALRRAFDGASGKRRSAIFAALEAIADRGDAKAVAATFTIARKTFGRDDPRTERALARSARFGDGKAIASIVEELAFLTPDDPATQRFIGALEAGAKARRPDALLALAALHTTGGPVPIDFERAAGLYRAAAEAGSPEAQYRIALALSDGSGGARDPDAALAWMRKAAKAGYGPAKEAVARLAKLADAGDL